MRFPGSPLVRRLLFVGLVAIAIAAYGIFEIFINGDRLHGQIGVIASFGCFGLLLGACYAFDEHQTTDGGVANMPLARTILGGLAGLSLGLLWHWGVPTMLISCSVSALLGNLGMAWAKYVDF
jgi:hypothetical protein